MEELTSFWFQLFYAVVAVGFGYVFYLAELRNNRHPYLLKDEAVTHLLRRIIFRQKAARWTLDIYYLVMFVFTNYFGSLLSWPVWIIYTIIILWGCGFMFIAVFIKFRDSEKFLVDAINKKIAMQVQNKLPENPLWKEPFVSLFLLAAGAGISQFFSYAWPALIFLAVLRVGYQFMYIRPYQNKLEQFEAELVGYKKI